MEHFHSDWTFKPFTMLHVNAPSVSQLVKKWATKCTAKETSTTKNLILKVFLMQDFYFKRCA